MRRYAWLTPDFGSGYICRSLSIPLPLLDAVNGAIGKLCYASNWQEFGDMTPDQCASLATSMWSNYVEGISCMIGQVGFYATSALPDNCLPCDGSSHLRVDYPLLYAVIDGAFITDADNFITPDIADRFVMASGTRSVGDAGGADTHTLSIDEIPSHTHTIPGSACFPYGEIPEVCVTGGLLTQNSGSAGGGQAHNNLPPYIVLRAGIVAK